ncbi:D-apionate lactonase [Oricola thermophila]|uniref:Uncharacterized protein n=1 Tax=Oricola thermophila TaxID=2742145 RepID=A0A6N1VDD6_9HYPH|nr:hypothetical protein [Oricola thermophila]QKV18533.1 hypothetical protein HTY61_08755 [Oricola thermophila]
MTVDAITLYGTSQPRPHGRVLRAGRLEARLEEGNLRYVRYDGVEVIRAIAYIVRDRDWGTLQPAITDLVVVENAEEFEVSYTGTCTAPGAELVYQAVIAGAADGTLRFEVEATPSADFETNRCGFNVLHPIDGVSGRPVTVEHCDGTREDAVFPDLIEPWQPFKTLRSLTYRPGHLEVECRLLGDVFEMEDQRNWSDASYKTYVRPLELPWPYLMPAGETDRQSVVVNVRPLLPAPAMMSDDEMISVEIGAETGISMPRIGLVIAPEEVDDTLRNLEHLRDVAPQAILCHYDPAAGHGRAAIKAFARLQKAFPSLFELECVVLGNGDLDDELADVAAAVLESGLKLESVAVCPSVDRQSTPPGSEWPPCPPLADIYRAAREAFPDVTLGGGVFSYFTELNRKRPPVEMLDYVTHATNPIVHAADDDSVMETLETIPHITRSARAIIGQHAGYRLGPTTIGMRQNPYGSRTMDNPQGKRICMAHDDPRQRGRFAAAWTTGYAAMLHDTHIERWVPAAFLGARGIVDKTGLLPVGRVVRALARSARKRRLQSLSPEEKRLAVVSFEGNKGPEIICANLTPETLRVTNAVDATLQPFQVVRVDRAGIETLC